VHADNAWPVFKVTLEPEMGPYGDGPRPPLAGRTVALYTASSPQDLPRRTRDLQPLHATESLYAWGQPEGFPRLQPIQTFLDAVPDQQPLQGLRAARGDDFPVERLGRVVLLTIALRHAPFNDTLAELHRNPSLCRPLDIRAADEVPHDRNLSLPRRAR